MIPALSGLGYRLARYLTQTDEEQESVATCSREVLEQTLQPGDVLLIDGSSRISMDQIHHSINVVARRYYYRQVRIRR